MKIGVMFGNLEIADEIEGKLREILLLKATIEPEDGEDKLAATQGFNNLKINF
jgi:hypothetical protein